MNDSRILTIQDISCVGQCSLTVALPIYQHAVLKLQFFHPQFFRHTLQDLLDLHLETSVMTCLQLQHTG